MTNPNQIRDIWRTADAVTFDVDSTVITEEAIDELASFCGKGKQITELYILYFVCFFFPKMTTLMSTLILL